MMWRNPRTDVPLLRQTEVPAPDWRSGSEQPCQVDPDLLQVTALGLATTSSTCRLRKQLNGRDEILASQQGKDTRPTAEVTATSHVLLKGAKIKVFDFVKTCSFSLLAFPVGREGESGLGPSEQVLRRVGCPQQFLSFLF